MYPKPKIEVLGREWEPVMISADSDELAALGERAMLRFSSHSEPEFFVAPAGVMHAGWVVGIPRVPNCPICGGRGCKNPHDGRG